MTTTASLLWQRRALTPKHDVLVPLLDPGDGIGCVYAEVPGGAVVVYVPAPYACMCTIKRTVSGNMCMECRRPLPSSNAPNLVGELWLRPPGPGAPREILSFDWHVGGILSAADEVAALALLPEAWPRTVRTVRPHPNGSAESVLIRAVARVLLGSRELVTVQAVDGRWFPCAL